MSSDQFGSRLTFEEQKTRKLKYDLGPGYPDMPNLMRPVLNALCENMAQIERGDQGHDPAFNDQVSGMLEHGVRKVLGAHNYQACYTVHTGSIALHRAIASAKQFLHVSGRSRTKLFTTTPCIDIIPAMAWELIPAGVEPIPMSLENEFSFSDAERILTAINEHLLASDECGAILVLTSPENPTGRIWPKAVLEKLISSLNEERVVTILDHCFLLVSPNSGHEPNGIWELNNLNQPWIGVWDTGKTFGLTGEKLGFLILSHSRLVDHVKRAISITQYDVSYRSKALFSLILNSDRLEEFLYSQNEVCSNNLLLLIERLEPLGFSVLKPLGGTLALLRPPRGMSAAEAVESAYDAGVGLINARVFFADQTDRADYVRVALARTSKEFSEAVELLTVAWAK